MSGRVDPPELRIDGFAACWESLAGPPEFTQMVSLNFEQAGFHGRGAPQPPQQTG